MTCPKCGNGIYKGDILCTNCNYPVAMMSGVSTPNINYQTAPQTNEIQVEYVEQTTVKPMVQPPPQPKTSSLKNTNNKYSNYGESKKAITSLKFIIPIIIGLIALIFVGYGIFSFVRTIILDKKGQQLQENLSYYKIEFDDFMYEIPGDLTYQKEQNKKTLYISDYDIRWEMSIQVINATYSSARSRKASIKSYFQSIDYEVGNIIEEVHGSSTYLILEATKNNKNYLLAITKAGDSSKCFGISIINKDNIIDYAYLEKVSDILSNAKYQKSSNSENKIDFDFNNALK